jgi:hypothetical protein
MQRRQEMSQRSPVVYWSLFAATLAVDAVVLSWMAAEPYPANLYLVIAFHALVLSQLDLVSIWSAMGRPNQWWQRALPVPVVLLAAFLTARIMDEPVASSDSFMNHMAYFAIHAALLIAALWLLRRTAYWQRRTATAEALRFSLAQLLLLMTFVAVLATLVRRSPFFGDERWVNIAFLGSSVLLAVVNVCLWTLAWHWLLRFAASLAAAILLGLTIPLSAILVSDRVTILEFIIIPSHYLIQSIVLSLWLAVAPILPDPQPIAEGEPAPTPPAQ